MIFPQYFIDVLKNRAYLVRRVYLPTVVLLLVALSTCAQEVAKAALIDEFGKVSWDDYVARLDNLAAELTRKPNQQAYLIFQNGEVKNDRERFRFYRWGKDHLKLRGFDLSKFNFIRAADGKSLKTQLWIVPPGEKPDYTDGKWNLRITPETKPFIWTTSEWSCELACTAEHLGLDHFCEVLEENPKSRVNFVIRAASNRLHIKERSLITGILLKECRVSQNRFRFFLILESGTHSDYPRTEVWLLP